MADMQSNTALEKSSPVVPSVKNKRNLLDLVFHVAVFLKGANGVLETLSGTLLVFVSPAILQNWAVMFTRDELHENPNDFISLKILHLVNTLAPSAVTFAAIYLLTHGIVKIGLLLAVLLRKYHWYPWAIGILCAFLGYQIYATIAHFSLGLLALSLFDAAIIALTYREYVHHPDHPKNQKQIEELQT